MVNYFLVFVVATLGTYFLTPLVERIALKIGAVDHPVEERKVHKDATPRLGGLAIYISFMLALAAMLLCQYFTRSIPYLTFTPQLKGILTGATIILIVGMIDDVRGLSPWTKLIGQFVAASMLIVFGTQIDFMGNPLGGLISLGFWSVPLTLLWVVGLTNAINFIDGLDGLASGVSGIAAISLFAFAWQTGQTEIATFSIALAGSTLGFLRHNFYPAQIFMGDSGSMFLGFMVGAITVAGVMKSIVAVALLIPIVIMGVPLLDVVSSVFRRVRKGKPAMQADKSHIHHKLLRKGFSHPQTVGIIYVWCIILSVTAFAIELAPQSLRLVVFVVLGLTSLWLARFLGLLEH